MNIPLDNLTTHVPNTSVSYIPLDNLTTDIPNTTVPYIDNEYYKIGMVIESVIFPLLLIIGIPGNIITFVVMMKARNRQLSYCWYLAALVASDTTMLTFNLVFWLPSVSEYRFTNGFCKWVAILFYWFSTNSICLIVCLTIGRYMANKHPQQYETIGTPEVARVVIFMVAVLTFTLNVPQYFREYVPERRYSKSCEAYTNPSRAFAAYTTLHAIIFAFIPAIVVCILNIGIIKTLRRGDNISQSRDDHQMTLMLLILSFIFIAAILPQFIRHVFYSFKEKSGGHEDHAVYLFILVVTHMFYMTNNCVNFYLYCATVSMFRKDVKELLCWCTITYSSSPSINTQLIT